MYYMQAVIGVAVTFAAAGLGLKILESWFVNHQVVYPQRRRSGVSRKKVAA